MRITLRRGNDKHLRKGYPWVFSNQIAEVAGNPASGDVVEIVSAEGHVYGSGLFHSESLIAVRFLTAEPETPVDGAFFRRRIERAYRIRQAAFAGADHYRLLFSEADGMPGTIVDRYGDVITWSCLSFGMEARRDQILDELARVAGPSVVVERNDNPLRRKDGMEESTGVLRGSLDKPVIITENNVRFTVDVLGGPKTGFFMDQRMHRQVIRHLARDRRVVDVFCADGGFGLQAAAGGAQSVHFVDVAQQALDRVMSNARLNGLEKGISCERVDALDWLGEASKKPGSYDLIVLDPPAFAKSRRDVETATRAYQRININALQMLEAGGILATSSCSQAISEADFLKILRYAARRTGTRLRTLFRGCQPPDHPVIDAMPETSYLKFYVFEKMGDESPGQA
jgi:23S rRNA (cytosine1962-C5)-methyltransferase